MSILFPVVLLGWVLAVKGAGLMERGPRVFVALALGGCTFVSFLLDARAVLPAAAVSSVAFALICFVALSLLADAKGLVRWLLTAVAGTMLLFVGVIFLNGCLADTWRRPVHRIDAASAPDEGEPE